MVIGPYISITTLNVNGLNAWIKRKRLAEQMKTCAYCTCTSPHDSAWPKPYAPKSAPQIVCDCFILLG